MGIRKLAEVAGNTENYIKIINIYVNGQEASKKIISYHIASENVFRSMEALYILSSRSQRQGLSRCR